MPGMLKPAAKCPRCGAPLIAVINTTNRREITREYYHDREPDRKRRRPKCTRVFRLPVEDLEADREMNRLNVRFTGPTR